MQKIRYSVSSRRVHVNDSRAVVKYCCPGKIVVKKKKEKSEGMFSRFGSAAVSLLAFPRGTSDPEFLHVKYVLNN